MKIILEEIDKVKTKVLVEEDGKESVLGTFDASNPFECHVNENVTPDLLHQVAAIVNSTGNCIQYAGLALKKRGNPTTLLMDLLFG